MVKENENIVKEITIKFIDETYDYFENVKIWTCASHIPMLVVDFGKGKSIFNLNQIQGYSFLLKEDE